MSNVPLFTHVRHRDFRHHNWPIDYYTRDKIKIHRKDPNDDIPHPRGSKCDECERLLIDQQGVKIYPYERYDWLNECIRWRRLYCTDCVEIKFQADPCISCGLFIYQECWGFSKYNHPEDAETIENYSKYFYHIQGQTCQPPFAKNPKSNSQYQ